MREGKFKDIQVKKSYVYITYILVFLKYRYIFSYIDDSFQISKVFISFYHIFWGCSRVRLSLHQYCMIHNYLVEQTFEIELLASTSHPVLDNITLIKNILFSGNYLETFTDGNDIIFIIILKGPFYCLHHCIDHKIEIHVESVLFPLT